MNVNYIDNRTCINNKSQTCITEQKDCDDVMVSTKVCEKDDDGKEDDVEKM